MTKDHPVAAAIAACALAAIVGVYALLGTASMSALGSVFPITAAVTLLIAAALLLLRALWAARKGGAVVVAEQELPTPPPAGGRQAVALRFLGTGVILLAWAWLLKPLGFILCAAIGCAALALLAMRERMGVKAIALHVLAGAVLILGFYILMAEVLRLSVPTFG